MNFKDIRTGSGGDRPKSQLENDEFAKTRSTKGEYLAGRIHHPTRAARGGDPGQLPVLMLSTFCARTLYRNTSEFDQQRRVALYQLLHRRI
jgi:hypothetical protein